MSNHETHTEAEQIRRENLEKIIGMGINPFPAAQFHVNAYSTDILEQFEAEKDHFQDVVLAGRFMGKRVMGKASFAELQDSKGRIQLYVNRDEICPGEDKALYNDLFKKYLDIGDFIGVRGYVFKTQVGETSVHVKEITFLSKSLRPLPVVKVDSDGQVHDAFVDPELRHRMRYVDLIVNKGVKETFVLRSKIVQAMRTFFIERDYLEVDTPTLQAIPGGAAARPFVTHHNALDIPLYLRIANELYLKRLIVGGFEGVFEFSRNFRNEGIDRTHNPEFTAMEIYVAYKDYHWMMQFTEELLEYIANTVLHNTKVLFGDREIDFKGPYRRLPIFDAIKEYAGIDVSSMDEEALRVVCRDKNIPVDPSMGKSKLIDQIFGELCEPNLIQPTFITDYPIEMSPLCKRHRDNPDLTERFELFVNGKELANAYSELNDPIDQKERFVEQAKLADRGDDEAMVIDHDFIRALEFGMPPTSGMGIGIDRLCMFLTNNASIQEVLLFPQMRPEGKE
jgi:lysyl-tRNA synthetase class 2